MNQRESGRQSSLSYRSTDEENKTTITTNLAKINMQKLTLKQLDAGVAAAFTNAGSLIEEAKILYQAGFHARAYTLSHIAREELAKVTMLYTSGLRLLAEHPVNWSKLEKRLRDHKSKLTSDALVSYISTPGAVDKLDLEKMTGGSTTRNEWKNESLYIALKEGNFKTPSQMITPQKAKRTIELAMLAFEDAKSFVSLGGNLTERKSGEAKRIFKHINPDKLEPSDVMELIKTLTKLIHSKTKSQDEASK
jgi:AbiV family abortive infection protein